MYGGFNVITIEAGLLCHRWLGHDIDLLTFTGRRVLFFSPPS